MGIDIGQAMAGDIGRTLEVAMSVISYWLYSHFPLVLAIIAVVGCCRWF
jgi:hypothetical protein